MDQGLIKYCLEGIYKRPRTPYTMSNKELANEVFQLVKKKIPYAIMVEYGESQ